MSAIPDAALHRAQRRRRAASAAAAGIGAKIVSVGTQLFTVPITLGYLGPERYGMWLVLSSFAAMLSFADFGIGNGILNGVAAAHARGDRGAIRTLISSGLLAVSVIAVAIMGAFAMAYPHIAWARAFNVHEPLARAEAGPAAAAFLLCFALSVPIGLVQRIQFGLQDGLRAGLWTGAGSVLTLPAILLAIRMRAGLPLLVALFFGVPLLTGLLNWLDFLRREPDLRPSLVQARLAEARGVARHGLLFMLIQLGNSVAAGCVPLVIAQVLGAQHVATYAVPERLLALVVMVTALCVQPLWPAYREAIVRGDRAWVAQAYSRTLLVVVIAGGIALMLLGLLMPLLLHLWVGSAVAPPVMLVAGLCLAKALEAALWVNAMLLNGLHLLWQQALAALANAAGTVLLAAMACALAGVALAPWAASASLFACAVLPGLLLIRRALRAAA